MLPDPAAEELRELVRLRERLLGDFGDQLRPFYRAVDWGFPVFTNHVRTLDGELAIGTKHTALARQTGTVLQWSFRYLPANRRASSGVAGVAASAGHDPS